MGRCDKKAAASLIWPDGRKLIVCVRHLQVARNVLGTLGCELVVAPPPMLDSVCEQVIDEPQMLTVEDRERFARDFRNTCNALAGSVIRNDGERIPDFAQATASNATGRPIFAVIFVSKQEIYDEIAALIERRQVERSDTRRVHFPQEDNQ